MKILTWHIYETEDRIQSIVEVLLSVLLKTKRCATDTRSLKYFTCCFVGLICLYERTKRMTQMWITAGTEGWWKAHGWKELRRAVSQGVEEILMEHKTNVDYLTDTYDFEENRDIEES